MNKTVLILFLIATIFSCKQENGKREKALKNHIKLKDSLTSKLRIANSDGELVGFSVAIIDQNKLLYNQGFGYADSKNKREYKTNTIQNVGSVSKTFIGISLLKAQSSKLKN